MVTRTVTLSTASARPLTGAGVLPPAVWKLGVVEAVACMRACRRPAGCAAQVRNCCSASRAAGLPSVAATAEAIPPKSPVSLSNEASETHHLRGKGCAGPLHRHEH